MYVRNKIYLFCLCCLPAIFAAGCVHEPSGVRLTPEQEAARIAKSAKIHTELASEYFFRRQYKVALEEIDAALKSNANYAPAYNVLGLIYMVLDDNSKAQSNFERALRLAPGDPEIQNNYGWFLCERYPDQIDRAIDHFRRAINDPLYETPHVAYANAGLCEIKRNNFAEASVFLRESLTLHSSYTPALVGLIEMDFKRGQLVAAQSRLTEFKQKYSPTVKSLELGIHIERAMGNPRAVDSYMFQLQKLFPDSKEARAAREGRL
jgi:type IV pilus assembly protein PilF